MALGSAEAVQRTAGLVRWVGLISLLCLSYVISRGQRGSTAVPSHASLSYSLLS